MSERTDYNNPDLQELRKLLDNKFWKGPDVATAEDCVLPGRDIEARYGEIPSVEVNINASHFPTRMPLRALEYLEISTRSRYAHLGIQVPTLSIDKPIWEKMLEGQEQQVPVSVTNFCARPILLPKGTPLFRLFTYRAAKLLEGNELQQAVASGKIKIDGEIGQDSITVNIENHKWIRPSDSPIHISKNRSDYRKEIDKLLVPIPQDQQKRILWIAETKPIKLSSGINAVLGMHLGLDAKQIYSRLINSSFEGSVRVEGFSSTLPEHLPHTATFFFYR
jgi:hypothetical protein